MAKAAQGGGGYSGINVMGGGGGQMEPSTLHPKKYKTGDNTFGSCRNFGLN